MSASGHLAQRPSAAGVGDIPRRAQADGALRRVRRALGRARVDHRVHALLKNLYDTQLVRDGHRWVLRGVVIDNVWFTGDPAAIFG